MDRPRVRDPPAPRARGGYTPPMTSPLTPPVVLWDDGLARLGPLTHTRPAHDVRTGAFTLRERMETAGIKAILTIDAPGGAALDSIEERLPLGTSEAVVVASSCVAHPAALTAIEPGRRVVDAASGRFVACRVAREEISSISRNSFLEGAERSEAPCLLERPWDVIRHRDATLAMDLSLLLASDRWARQTPPGVVVVGDGRVAIDPSADVLPSVVLDTSGGPIIIERNATVRPGAILCGPAYIGPFSTVLDRTLIKANTAIGPVCKVAGEVGGSVFQGFANKAHDGHLGDSWVGEWANLGAGTTNSNLLNTYGEITARADAGAPRERTGLNFFGTIVGDHVKTAISTRLFTGTVLGTGAMIASTTPPDASTPPFAWVTDAGTKTFRIDKFLDVARLAMARRDVEMSPDMERQLRELHAKAPS